MAYLWELSFCKAFCWLNLNVYQCRNGRVDHRKLCCETPCSTSTCANPEWAQNALLSETGTVDRITKHDHICEKPLICLNKGISVNWRKMSEKNIHIRVGNLSCVPYCYENIAMHPFYRETKFYRLVHQVSRLYYIMGSYFFHATFISNSNHRLSS